MKYYMKEYRSELFDRISYYVIAVAVIAMLFFSLFYQTDNYFKDQVIRKSNSLFSSEEINAHSIRFNMDVPLDSYYEAVSIVKYSDEVSIIAWGDRKSWLWRFKGDRRVTIFKSSHNSKDQKIFLILDKILLKESLGN